MSKLVNQDSANHREENKEEEVVIIKDDDLWGRGLPTELLELILSKLNMFVVDIQKFHAVCKTWQSITVSVSPPRQLPSPLPYADSSFPLLFQFVDYFRKYRVLHPLYNYTWDFEFLRKVRHGPKELYFSKYGWLLMVRDCRYPILFNPLTQEIKKLPSIMPVFSGNSHCMFFTCPPSQPDCLVVAILGHLSSIYIHKLGEADWKKHKLKGKMDHCFFELRCHPILYQGLCYCLDRERNLAVFDIQDIQHTWIVHENLLPSPSDVRAVLELVEHNGQLLVVLIEENDLYRPHIFELDLKTKLCAPTMQISLEKNALFISRGASFSQRAVVSATGNKSLFQSW